jgi:hypothetical protein
LLATGQSSGASFGSSLDVAMDMPADVPWVVKPSAPAVSPALISRSGDVRGRAGVGSSGIVADSGSGIVAASGSGIAADSGSGSARDEDRRRKSTTSRQAGRQLRRASMATDAVTGVAAVLNLLLVDDSKLNRRMLARLLSTDDGYCCDEAEDGVLAVRCVENKLPEVYDAILMDFMMVRSFVVTVDC